MHGPYWHHQATHLGSVLNMYEQANWSVMYSMRPKDRKA